MRRLAERAPELAAEVRLRQSRGGREVVDLERIAVAGVGEVLGAQQVACRRDWVHPAHACSMGKGSTGSEPFAHQPSGQYSKCRCGPSDSPVLPTEAIRWPDTTACPSATRIEPVCRCMNT